MKRFIKDVLLFQGDSMAQTLAPLAWAGIIQILAAIAIGIIIW